MACSVLPKAKGRVSTPIFSNSSSRGSAGSLNELFTVQFSKAALLSSVVAQNAWEHWGEGGWYSNMRMKKKPLKKKRFEAGQECNRSVPVLCEAGEEGVG